jgi:hypothetical protein
MSCNKKKGGKEFIVKNDTAVAEKQISKADSLINEAIEAHGGNLYNKADYSFVFRYKKCRFKNDGNNYEYISDYKKGDSIFKDFMTNNNFKRYINT